MEDLGSKNGKQKKTSDYKLLHKIDDNSPTAVNKLHFWDEFIKRTPLQKLGYVNLIKSYQAIANFISSVSSVWRKRLQAKPISLLPVTPDSFDFFFLLVEM